jgi:HTH-type transcriptional regulator/antitoxin HigA
MSEIRPIRNETDYEATLAEVERLWGARSGTPEGDRLDVLATLIDAYESEHDPIDPPDPIDAIKFRMEQQQLTRKDLEGIFGTRTRVAEVLNRRRGLSITMIRHLADTLKIPADILIRPSRGALSTNKAPCEKSEAGDRIRATDTTLGASPSPRVGVRRPIDEYWVYQNWTVDRARVHRGTCSYCNHGLGIHRNSSNRNSEWRGPFTDRAAAFAVMTSLGRTDSRACDNCAP